MQRVGDEGEAPKPRRARIRERLPGSYDPGMREVRLPKCELSIDTASFLACLATILELPFEQLPVPAAGEDPATGWTVSRWLGGLGLADSPDRGRRGVLVAGTVDSAYSSKRRGGSALGGDVWPIAVWCRVGSRW